MPLDADLAAAGRLAKAAADGHRAAGAVGALARAHAHAAASSAFSSSAAACCAYRPTFTILVLIVNRKLSSPPHVRATRTALVDLGAQLKDGDSITLDHSLNVLR